MDHNRSQQAEDFHGIEQYILSIPKFSAKNTLEELKEFMEYMGNPGLNKKIIHVAGTNGKGSVCAYLQSVLAAAGFRTGMFTSPHLVTMRERIQICGEMISEEVFSELFYKILAGSKKFSTEKSGEQKKFHPSFFEFLFAMAMTAFEEAETEYIILETGLGGRLDATNIIPAPRVCVITQIGYDHMEILGDTLTLIAGEKAGIMKPGVPVVFPDKSPEVTAKLLETAEAKGCPVLPVREQNIKIVKLGNKTIDFSLHTRYYMYGRLSLITKARYQTENAALAVQAAEVLAEQKITGQAVQTGLLKAFWPGRMEEIEPGIFLDGAHNEDGMRAFLQTVAEDDAAGARYLLFGAVRDKNFREMARMIAESGLFAKAVLLPLETERSLSLAELKATFIEYALPCIFCENTEEALATVKQWRQEGDLAYIAGSLYLAGQIIARENSK